MSESISAPAVFSQTASQYRLSDDLARLCLPQEYKDSYRTLAWVNSICALFLLVGLIGLKSPRIIVRPIAPVMDAVPVVWTPPEEQQPNPSDQPKPDDTEPQPTDMPTDVPQVAQVVAPADANVAFAVPVQGAVQVVKEARFAPPPPAVLTAPPAPKPTNFNPHANGGEGVFPDPIYPSLAQRNQYQGTVIIEIKVEESGAITSATVHKSSGFKILDDAALQVVERRWRFTPGPKRWLLWPCTFKLQ